MVGRGGIGGSDPFRPHFRHSLRMRLTLLLRVLVSADGRGQLA